jgi:hemoglobin/transferrin/lactoferrin receptor protein
VRSGNFDILGQANGRWTNDYEDGDGSDILNSGDTTKSYLGKARWRLAEGHEVTATIIDYHSEFIDQTDSLDAVTHEFSSAVARDSDLDNRQYSLGYTFARPDTPLIDFSAKIYRNITDLDQVRLTPGAPSIPEAGPFNPCPTPCEQAGAKRGFHLETEGFDVFNTSKFAFSNVRTALTYGGDAFRDEVTTLETSPGGNADEFTPGGERTVAGAFIQSKTTFFEVVDIIAAARYDTYDLEGEDGATLEGDRVSPKVTAGITPLNGLTLFATYAEGYRAPAVTEVFNAGVHPPPAPPFNILPNPDLEPEVAHNVEGGVNLKYDGIVTSADKFRAKFVAFQNKVDDYIDGVFVFPPDGPAPFSFQYQNIANATLEGLELEGTYDAHLWFVGVTAAKIRGTNDVTGNPLLTIPADQITVTAGFRALEDKLLVGARGHFVAAQDRVPPIDPVLLQGGTISQELLESDAYTVVDLFAQYVLTDEATINVNIDNIFDEDYRQYLDLTDSPGLNARVGLTMRLGAQ